jgi:carboxymethylenebutenolidase
MEGSIIEVAAHDGGRFNAYIARPVQGSGPGLVLLQEIFGINDSMKSMADRFAEEGYVVLVPDLFWRIKPGIVLGYQGDDLKQAYDCYSQFDAERAVDDIAATLAALRALPEHKGKVGTVGYCLGGKLAYLAATRTDVDCAVSYYGVGIDAHLDEAANLRCPLMLHYAENDPACDADARARIGAALAKRPHVDQYVYAGCDHAFASPGRAHYDKPAAMMAYSRTLALLRRVLGPVYDLNALWEQHCYFEFATRDVEAVMPTMVAQPYVNHVPTMTGGVGHDKLKHFYTHHFVHSNPADTRLIPISRTIGSDRVVDEFIFACTHSCEIDWLLPGVAPTGKYFEVPMLAVVCFRGDKLYNEHIYWDQASVLAQVGLIDPKGLPVAGIESARKLLDESLPSNELMGAKWRGGTRGSNQG